MSLRTPLGKVLGLGSARDGTEHWWGQRVSAAGLALLGLWFAGSLWGMEAFTHDAVTAFIAAPLNGVFLVLLAMTVAYHSHLGVQVVIEDYVHAPAAKVISLILSRFLHIFIAVLSVYAILRIGFGA